ALRNGALSADQATEIASAANAQNEERLLKDVGSTPLPALKRRCAEERNRTRSAEAEAARRERVRRKRHYRSWTDADGAYRFEGSLPTVDGARLDAAVAAMTEVVFKEAYAEGRR